MRRLSLAAALVAGSLVLAACSGTSGTVEPAGASSSAAAAAPSSAAAPALEAAKVGSAVAEAAAQASSVRVKGTMASEGNINLDLQLNQDSASGTVVKDGIEIPVLRVGDKYYFRFTDSLIKEAGIPASVGKKLSGKWVPSTAKIGAGIGDAFKVFLDYKSFTDNTVGELKSATFTGGEPTTLGGVAALNFTSPEGTATVAADAPHYLLRMQDPKSGAIEFGDWNKPTTVKAPPASEIYSGPGA
ncbi:hypothetical protein [Amycolatopsis sp. SID8362]|uniref:hypothetical protein n=1 Tax=Amycolatopsis sp. SID8362 TaxID=2690346 RepID=UPI00136EE395|nr:hypothetical protein [Amycolatopsis sp. SID8362]NBH06604.1 hypothetical protein [Amycolatopsis sp. SID8362]NED43301.1 hypothetical protein [Amycolatopsis sp. SID8362]